MDVEVDGPRVAIVCGSARFSLPTMPVEDYPQLPQMPATGGTVDGDEFAEAVTQAAVAAGRDDTLPMLTGDPGGDRGREADPGRHRPVPAGGPRAGLAPGKPGMSTAVLVPARTLADAAKTPRRLGTEVHRRRSARAARPGRQAGAAPRSGCWTWSSSKYRSLMPSEHTTTARRAGRAARRGDQARRLVTDRGHHLRLQVATGR